MSDPAPKYAFSVAVVGDASVMPEGDLARLLDLLVNRHLGERRIVLLSPGGGPGHKWAAGRHYTTILVPNGKEPVRQQCELVATADAVVVLGDPGPWRRLLALCREAGIPTRVYRTRPSIPPPSPPAWEVDG